MNSKIKAITGVIALTMGLSLQEVDAQQEEINAARAVMEAVTNAVGNATNTNANATESAMTEANKLIAAASNDTNVTEFNTKPSPDLGINTDDGVGYYPPPYSYNECLNVFSKESCDFRFNR